MLAIWFLTILSPFELSFKITGNMFVEIFSIMLNGAYGAGSVLSTIDLAVGLYPKNHVAPIVLGFVNGCGGAILSPIVFNLIKGHHLIDSFFANGIFSVPFLTPLAASVFYYYTKYILKITEFQKYQIPNQQIVHITPEFIVRSFIAAVSVYSVIQRYLARPVSVEKSSPAKKSTSPPSTTKKTTTTSQSSSSSITPKPKTIKE